MWATLAAIKNSHDWGWFILYSLYPEFNGDDLGMVMIINQLMVQDHPWRAPFQVDIYQGQQKLQRCLYYFVLF
jgi:hypothetical protein